MHGEQGIITKELKTGLNISYIEIKRETSYAKQKGGIFQNL